MTKTPTPPHSTSSGSNHASNRKRASRKRPRDSNDRVVDNNNSNGSSKNKELKKKATEDQQLHQQQQPDDEHKSSMLSPHTHRLLRLIKEGTSDHARMAAIQLESIARQLFTKSSSSSSSKKLWDLVGYLQSYLVNVEWNCRYNASVALKGVAQYIPIEDQIEFLKSDRRRMLPTDKNNNNSDKNEEQSQPQQTLLWLHVQNVWDDFDTILANGRLLYSSSGTQYEEYQKEQEQLQTLDSSSTNKQFVQERVIFQRQILAQRLGLVNHPLLGDNHDQLLDTMIDQEDVVRMNLGPRNDNNTIKEETPKLPSSSCPQTEPKTKEELIQERRQKHVQRIIQSSSKINSNKNSKKKKKNEESNTNPYSIRALLVRGMQQQQEQQNQQNQKRVSSHCDPQTLLATEFIYRMFDPNWYIRHGSLLGALSLLKAWRGRHIHNPHQKKLFPKDNNHDASLEYSFGVWPQDILARVLCVIALDRFGDYSTTGTTTSSSSSSSGIATTEIKQRSTVVIAPVRETAAQLVTILMTMAPPSTQLLCFQIISQRMIPYRNHGDGDGDCWEVRHGAMLTLKYLAAILTTITTTTIKNASAPATVTNSTSLSSSSSSKTLARFTTDIINLAIQGLVDDSDDVKGVAAQVLSCFLTAQLKPDSDISKHQTENFKMEEPPILCYFTYHQLETMSQSLWTALQTIHSVSSCVVDIVDLFSRILCYDCTPLLQAVRQPPYPSQQTNGNSENHHIESDHDIAQSLNIILQKLVDFLDYDLPAVKLSSLQAIGVIVEPISFAGQKTTQEFCNTRNAKSPLSTLQQQHSLAATYCNLLKKVFDAHFDIPTNSMDSASLSFPSAIDTEESRHAKQLTTAIHSTWEKLVKYAQSFLREVPHQRNDLLLILILRYVGLRPDASSAAKQEQASKFIRIDDLISEQNFDSSNNHMFSIRHSTAQALARLLSDLILNSTEKRSSVLSVAPSVFWVCDLLETVVSSLLQSPWLPLVEAGCFLFGELHTVLTVSKKESGSKSFFYKSMQTCNDALSDLLQSGPLCVVELKSGHYTGADDDNASKILKELVDMCDQSLVATLQSQLLVEHSQKIKKYDGTDSVSTQLVMMWRRACKAKAPGMTRKFDASINLDSVRVKALITGAFLSRGRAFLPSKLTPLIRPLMTSMKNENFESRHDLSCIFIVQLIQYLSFDRRNGTEEVNQSHSRVREKLLGNICSMLAPPRSQNAFESSFTIEQRAAQRVISQLVSEISHEKTVECIEAIWSNLESLTKSDPSTASTSELANTLSMLQIVASSLNKGSATASHLIKAVVPAVVLIACASPSPASRQASISILRRLCHIEPIITLERGIPFVLQKLNDVENDAYRYGGSKVLFSLIEASKMDICPFVRLLLPIAMSLMTDPMEECSRIASRSFAALVRVAPLVQQSNCRSIPGMDTTDCRAEKVIDHLIHGKPFPPFTLPDAVKNELSAAGVSLRNYQSEGVAWIQFLQSVNLNGALCDDMGLGKTLQALIGVSISKHDEGSGRKISLVICPSTVVGHWMSEINNYFPSQKVFRAFALVGNAKQRDALWKAHLSKANIVVISYHVLRSEINRLVELTWHYCILDEGHLLKNHKTATAVAARRLRSRHRLILTGTPVQNRVNELWATFDFLMPSFLGSSSHFQKEFAKPIYIGHQLDASAGSIHLAMEKLKLLHQQVLPFILRREKGQVLKELPPKCITDIPCTLSPEQENLYKEFCKGTQGQKCLAQLQNVIQDANHDTNNNTHQQKDTSATALLGKDVLKSLLFLRLLCTHPCLVSSPRHSNSAVAEPDFVESQFGRFEHSGKLQALQELLQSAGICVDSLTAADNDTSILFCDDEEETNMANDDNDDYNSLAAAPDGGDRIGGDWEYSSGANNNSSTTTKSKSKKCLIFAQFIQSLDVVEQLLFQPHMPSLRYVRLDGRVPQERRSHIVETFNSDDSISVLLLTTRIGGLGLNLTGADTVIFLEHDWNPHNDLQAMDRAHRIGQTRTVNVYRLVTRNTIEEKIMELQKIKISIANAIVNTDNSSMYSMGTDRLLDIFTFQSDSSTALSDGIRETNPSKEHGTANLDYLDDMYSTQEEYGNLSMEDFMRGYDVKSKQLTK